MARPPLQRPAVAEPSAPDDDALAGEAPLEPEELASAALEGRVGLTPEVVRALNDTWRELVQYDDNASRERCRKIAGILRRAKHTELHPGCERVTMDVPMLANRTFARINERVYFGRVEVWECEARTLASLIYEARRVEAQRMDDRQSEHPTLDLDSPFAERARAIQRA